jgi:uncharacterized membrane protein
MTQPVIGLGNLWITLIALVPVVLIGLTVYSIWALRKPENWEQK